MTYAMIERYANISDQLPKFSDGKLENLNIMKLGITGAAYESPEKVFFASL